MDIDIRWLKIKHCFQRKHLQWKIWLNATHSRLFLFVSETLWHGIAYALLALLLLGAPFLIFYGSPLASDYEKASAMAQEAMRFVFVFIELTSISSSFVLISLSLLCWEKARHRDHLLQQKGLFLAQEILHLPYQQEADELWQSSRPREQSAQTCSPKKPSKKRL